jgi:hypothetical protein
VKTIELTQDEMFSRVARFRNLTPLPNQRNEAVPLEVMDAIFARTILSVIGLEGDETPVSQGAPIQGAGGMMMGIGVCRAFRNIGTEDGLLQAIITGGVHDKNDIDFSRNVGARLSESHPEALAYFEKVGFTFNASRSG